MDIKKTAELIRSVDAGDDGLLDQVMGSVNPVALALAILDQCGYSATVTAKVAELLEVA